MIGIGILIGSFFFSRYTPLHAAGAAAGAASGPGPIVAE